MPGDARHTDRSGNVMPGTVVDSVSDLFLSWPPPSRSPGRAASCSRLFFLTPPRSLSRPRPFSFFPGSPTGHHAPDAVRLLPQLARRPPGPQQAGALPRWGCTPTGWHTCRRAAAAPSRLPSPQKNRPQNNTAHTHKQTNSPRRRERLQRRRPPAAHLLALLPLLPLHAHGLDRARRVSCSFFSCAARSRFFFLPLPRRLWRIPSKPKKHTPHSYYAHLAAFRGRLMVQFGGGGWGHGGRGERLVGGQAPARSDAVHLGGAEPPHVLRV